MGLALWAASGTLACLLARLIARGRRSGWPIEIAIALPAALALGTLATALDFGGWKEPDWRAGVFVLIGSFAAIGAFRVIGLRSES